MSRSQQRLQTNGDGPSDDTRPFDHPSYSTQKEVKDNSPHRRKNSSSLDLFSASQSFGSPFSQSSHHDSSSSPSHSNDKFSPFVTTASPVHLSSSNQVANFNTIPTSPVRAGENGCFSF